MSTLRDHLFLESEHARSLVFSDLVKRELPSFVDSGNSFTPWTDLRPGYWTNKRLAGTTRIQRLLVAP